MTSPSRRNRRITAWSTAIAISALAGGTLVAQSPQQGMGQPAPTTWQQYTPPAWQPYTPPAPKPVPAPVVPPIPLPEMPPPAAAPMQKPVEFIKPANDVRPVELPSMKMRDVVLPPPPASVPLVPKQVTVPMQSSPKPKVMPIPNAAPPAPFPAQPAVRTKPQPPPTPAPQPVPMQPVPMQTQPSPMQTQPAPLPPVTTPGQPGMPSADDIAKYRASLGGLPTKGELFRLDSDKVLDARILRDLTPPGTKERTDAFPVAKELTESKYEPKTASYSPYQLLREPNYVIHRHLYFEEMNAERAGWDAGPAQALFSTMYFFRDTLLLPSRFGSHCKDCYDSSAGKCMPGAPTPYYCYPLGITTFGGAVGATVITGAVFILAP